MSGKFFFANSVSNICFFYLLRLASVTYESDEAENNLKLINKLNQERINEDDAFFSPNKFSEYSHEDFLERFAGLQYETDDQLSETEFPDDVFAATCKRLNWAEFGVIPDVRDQRDCGVSYAFASMDLIAAQYSIDRSLWNQSYLLSPQYIIDCLGSPMGLGCKGGRPLNVIKEVASHSTVIPKESCYPYIGQVGQCLVPTCKEETDEEELSVFYANFNDNVIL